MNKVFLQEYHAFSLLKRFNIPFAPYSFVDQRCKETGNLGIDRAVIRAPNCPLRIVARDELKTLVSELLETIASDEKIVIIPEIECEKRYRIWAKCTMDQAEIGICEEGGKEYTEQIAEIHSLYPFQMRRLLSHLSLTTDEKNRLKTIIQGLERAFIRLDAVAIELSPVGLSEDGLFHVLGASMYIDQNALFRQKEIAYFVKIAKKPFWYTRLEGNIGCMANGQGLVEATADLVESAGAAAACMVSIGEQFAEKDFVEAFRFLQEEKEVQYIFINLFTGIKSCEKIAKWIKKYVVKSDCTKKVVLRLDGTEGNEGNRLLQHIKPWFYVARTCKQSASTLKKVLEK